MKIFILEDEIHQWPRKQILEALKGHDLTIATSCDEAKSKYKPNTYDLLLLDHDMRGFFDASDFPNTGFQFVLWLLSQNEQDKKRPQVMLHSQNPTGRRNMYLTLQQAGYTVGQMAFSGVYVDWLRTKIGSMK